MTRRRKRPDAQGLLGKVWAERIHPPWRKLVRDCSGGIAVVYGFAVPVLVGLVGVSAETGTWYVAKRALQTEADAAAIGGAWQLAYGNTGNIASISLNEAKRNGFPDDGEIDVNNPPESGAYDGEERAVEVVLQTNHAALFSALFRPEATNISARAVATIVQSGDACVLALNRVATKALENTGSTTVNAPDCTVASNSSSNNAVNFSGNADLTFKSVWSAGGYQVGGSATVNLAEPAKSHMWPIDDPYADLVSNAPAGCNINTNQNINGSKTFTPINGNLTICNDIKITNGANVNFLPGTYWFKGADISIEGGNVHCSTCSPGGNGVTFIFTTPASGDITKIGSITINGNASVTLNAPSDGPFQGVLFFQDRDAPVGASAQTAKLNGGAGTALNGTMYFPGNTIEWSGNIGLNSTCTLPVADEVTFIGNSGLDISNCAEQGVDLVLIQKIVLAE